MLTTRVATALVALPPVVAGIIFLPSPAVAAIFALFMLLGAWEWGALLAFAGAWRGAFVAAVAAVMSLVEGLHASTVDGNSEHLIIAIACAWWLGAIYWIARFPADSALQRWYLGAVAGVIALAAPVAAVADLHQSADGPLLLLLLFGIVWGADTGAYFAGRACGRHKLAPNVSPGKTFEGAIGGLLTATAIAAGGAWGLGYHGARILGFIGLGAWVAALSIVGDLTLSLFKRHAGLKDSGMLFPGHGGVLDRLDSLIAAAPWFVAGLHWLPAQF
jgi:phosphatidate cytidylyltransferase